MYFYIKGVREEKQLTTLSVSKSALLATKIIGNSDLSKKGFDQNWDQEKEKEREEVPVFHSKDLAIELWNFIKTIFVDDWVD